MSPVDHHDNQAARARIFAKLKTVLNDGPNAQARRVTVDARLAKPPQHPLPERVKKSADDLRQQFRGYLEGQSATVVDVASEKKTSPIWSDVRAALLTFDRAGLQGLERWSRSFGQFFRFVRWNVCRG